ncbi:hypothetical protein NDU88_006845 [Pleurodeles waltl]|uniref:Uncharacterized protein n=1 Tax=Pleurodeles waltl TaxID=8319 RepID=A0AAV7X2H7_PLEWA|nr:hypothetical protein NDU88_006845 [Pleurodeles waltl]
MLGRSLSCLLFAVCCTCTGVTALFGWLLMAPKAIKTPRTLRGKPSLGVTAVRREKKQLAVPLKDRTGAQGKGAQKGWAPSLELIYRTMVHNHEQAQKESRKAKIANRHLQSSIKRVVKSCQDISTRITSMETRTDVLETEVKATVTQTALQGQQILDMQWKPENAENRQRRNNLWILGIAEGLEG